MIGQNQVNLFFCKGQYNIKNKRLYDVHFQKYVRQKLRENELT